MYLRYKDIHFLHEVQISFFSNGRLCNKKLNCDSEHTRLFNKIKKYKDGFQIFATNNVRLTFVTVNKANK